MEPFSFLNKRNETRVDPSHGALPLLNPLFFCEIIKSPRFVGFNIRKLGKSGCCRRFRRLMDVRRRVWSSRGNSVLRHRGVATYRVQRVLRAINKLYYTPRGVFHESFIGGALRWEARVDTFHGFIHKRISLSSHVYEILESCGYYAQREIILKYALARNASAEAGIGYNFERARSLCVYRLEMEYDNFDDFRCRCFYL